MRQGPVTPRLRVLFVTGGTSDPASRFRVLQFFPALEAAGVACDHVWAYGDSYNRLFGRKVVGAGYKLLARARRAVRGLIGARYDVVVLQRTAFNDTALPERLLARLNPRIVLDVDDAVFVDQTGRTNHRKERVFRQAVALSRHVLAGNAHLVDMVDAPTRTTLVPTVIDTDRYRPAATRRPGERVVVGWMGTAGHFEYFPAIVPALLALLDRNPMVHFRMVCNARFEGLTTHPRVEQVTWREASELRELQSFDVGIMPLADNAWTRGKCGFKLIQYMATGVPAVASAVGANVGILAGGRAGMLIQSNDNWLPVLHDLVNDPEKRRAFAEAGRTRVVESYSIDSVLPTLLDVLTRTARRGAQV